MRRLSQVTFILVVGAAGCGGGDGKTNVDAAPIPVPDGQHLGAPDANDIVLPPDAMVGDDTDSFAQAKAVPVGDQDGVTGAIDKPADHDFFKFSGSAGQWLQIMTDANPSDDPNAVDTVITLYDSDMEQVAENDDAVPRVSTDSEIFIRLPAAGQYYVEVQEYSDWDGQASTPAEGQAGFIYRLVVFPVDEATQTGIKAEVEPNDTAAAATAAEILTGEQGSNLALMLGEFGSVSDVDVWSLTIPTGARRYSSTAVMPSGDTGYGSTGAIGRAIVTDAAGTTVIARVMPQTGARFEMSPPLEAGEYRLLIERPEGASAGTNDFWVAKHFNGTQDNPAEKETSDSGGNDTTALADGSGETLTLEDRGGGKVGFVLAFLKTDADVDYIGFDAMAGDTVSIFCGSATEGSGVTGLKAELRNTSDQAMAMKTESATESIVIEEASVTNTGKHYLRLSKSGQDSTVTGNWVRCGLVVQ